MLHEEGEMCLFVTSTFLISQVVSPVEACVVDCHCLIVWFSS